MTTLGRTGVEYTNLHRELTAFFFSRGCGSDSKFLADAALDRVAKKINNGEDVTSVVAYSRKVAEFVWKEYCRQREEQERREI
jgi:hypothetical protein